MSFGFSIGDIVLLSGLAYDLYTSVSSGRKAASKDLQELEDVLFSLRCALDHLSETAKDVTWQAIAKPDLRNNLNRMIASCGATLQELDHVTKKYREVGIDEVSKEGAAAVKKSRTFDDAMKRFRVNWKKVRWDQEKQSLQQYREKLRSHTDAINIILSSIIWSNANKAEANSKTNHEKTHSLINQILSNPETDPSLPQLTKEMHSMLLQSQLQPRVDNFMTQFTSTGSAHRDGFGLRQDTHITSSSAVHTSGPSANALSGTFMLESPSKKGSSTLTDKSDYPSCHVNVAPLHKETDGNHQYNSLISTSSTKASLLENQSRHELPLSITTLNSERRAFATKEFNAYKQLNAKRMRPSFVSDLTLDQNQIMGGLEYLFRPLLVTVTNQVELGAQERTKEVVRWVNWFKQHVDDQAMDSKDSHNQLGLLLALNGSIEQSEREVTELFYLGADLARFTDVLDVLEQSTKSVRVIKEIEEFQDAREGWDSERS